MTLCLLELKYLFSINIVVKFLGSQKQRPLDVSLLDVSLFFNGVLTCACKEMKQVFIDLNK